MKKRSDPYDALADVYDLMAADSALQAFYREWRELLLQTVRDKRMRVRTAPGLRHREFDDPVGRAARLDSGGCRSFPGDAAPGTSKIHSRAVVLPGSGQPTMM